MPELLQNWLSRKLGIILDLTPDVFSKNIQDGQIIACILQSYNIVNADFVSKIRHASNIQECYYNFRLIKPYLDFLGVECNIHDIVECDRISAINLLFTLYTVLEDKDIFYYLTSKCNSDVKRKFDVLQVDDDTGSTYSLVKPPPFKQNIIEWHRSNCEKIIENIQNVKRKFQKICEITNETSLPKPFTEYPTTKILNESSLEDMKKFEMKSCLQMKNQTYDELKSENDRIKEIKQYCVPDYEKGIEFIKSLQTQKRKLKMNSQDQEKQLCLMLKEQNNKFVKEENKLINELVVNKILKESQFEKQIITKLTQVQHEKKIMKENKQILQKLFTSQEDIDYISPVIDKVDKKLMTKEELRLFKCKQMHIHRKLYGQKIKKRKENLINEIRDIILTIADIAMFCTEYENEVGSEVPLLILRELKLIFFNGLHVYNDVPNDEVSIYKDEFDENGEIETEYQDVLSERDVDDYLFLTGHWDLLNISSTHGLTQESNLEILSYIINKILSIKYPAPQVPPPADIKPMLPTVIMTGVNNSTAVEILKELLGTQDILVVTINDALNFVLSKFKDNCGDVTSFFNDVPTEHKTDQDKLKNVKDAILSQDLNESNRSVSNIVCDEAKVHDVSTQTNDTDGDLESEQELGRMVFEALGLGQRVPDDITVSSIVSLVKNKENDYNGWVLVDFPLHFRQLRLLEQRLTGVEVVPGSDEYKNEKGEMIKSRIFPITLVVDSNQTREEKTYFSLFISVENEMEEEDDNVFKNEQICDFYVNQDIFYNFGFSSLNFEAVKQLAKLIIVQSGEETSLDRANSVELFGEMYTEIEQKWSTLKKKPDKQSKPKPPPTTNKVSGQNQEKKSITLSIQPPNEVVEETSIKDNEIIDQNEKLKSGDRKSKSSVSKIKQKVVSEEYQWTEVEIKEKLDNCDVDRPKEMSICLASLWERLELCYIEDLKKVLGFLRSHNNSVHTYTNSIKDKLKSDMKANPNNKQRLLLDFQRMFNDLTSMETRPDVDVKSELHCRVSEFERSLLDDVDYKKHYLENAMLGYVTTDRWLPDELTLVVNGYLSIVQLEIHRCLVTCCIVHDFITSTSTQEQLEHVAVDKLPVATTFDAVCGEDDEESVTDDLFSSCLLSLFNNPDKVEQYDTPYHQFCVNNISSAVKEVVDSVKMHFETKSNRLLAIVLNYEIERFLFRTKLLETKCLMDLDKLITNVREVFSCEMSNLGENYLTDVNNIYKCSKIFRCAIEEEKVVLEQMYFDDETNRFISSLSTDSGEIDVLAGDEQIKPNRFTIGQLTSLYRTMKKLSPLGEIPTNSFAILMGDFMDGYVDHFGAKILPDWFKTETRQLPDLFNEIYQSLEIVSWKDFIIYALDLPYPTVQELLDVRQLFLSVDTRHTELISKRDYSDVKLWFENVADDDEFFRLQSVKDFLFEMFQVDDDHANWTALLLTFCKDYEPSSGFIKSLCLSVGKLLIHAEETCPCLCACKKLIHRDVIKSVITSSYPMLASFDMIHPSYCQLFESTDYFTLRKILKLEVIDQLLKSTNKFKIIHLDQVIKQISSQLM